MNSLKNYLKSNTFKNKNVIVTGATGSIGSHVVQKLLQCGAKVVGFIHNQNKVVDYFQQYEKLLLPIFFT